MISRNISRNVCGLNWVVFIARQHAMHAQRDIISPIVYVCPSVSQSVSLSVCLSVCPMPVLCQNEWISHFLTF